MPTLLRKREAEADEFYEDLRRADGTDEEQLRHAPGVRRDALEQAVLRLQRRALARWRSGPAAAAGTARPARNAAWRHFDAADIMSMPDPWEYPWFAAWDLAFHAVTLAHIDPTFAKYQLLLLCREWFQHPNGALPAYEWSFDDVNPPVHAVGGVPRLGDRRASGHRLPQAHLPQAAAELHVVAEPRGRRGQRPVLGRLPRPRQHRRVRPLAPAGRDGARAVRRDGLDVRVLPLDAPHRDRPGRDGPGLRGPRDDVPRARRADRRGDEPERAVGRGRRLLLRRPQARRRLERPDQGPLDGRPHPAPADGDRPAAHRRSRAGAREALRRLHGRRSRLSPGAVPRGRLRHRATRPRDAARSASCRRSGWRAC